MSTSRRSRFALAGMVVPIVLALVAAACSGKTTVDTTAAAGATSAAAPAENRTEADDASATTDGDSTGDAADQNADDSDGSATNVDELGDLLFGSSNFSAELSPEQLSCALAELADNPGLLRRANGIKDVGQLPLEDQTDLAIIAFDCAPEVVAEQFADSFSSGGRIELPPQVGDCLIGRMSEGADDRRAVILGFAALGSDRAVPVEARPAVVDAMVACLPGDLFAQAIADVALADPMFESALDLACISDRLDGETLRPMWEALVESPGIDFEQLPPEATGPLLSAIFECVSFGEVVAAQAAASGVTISDESVACIDRDLADVDIAALTQSDDGAEEIGVVLLGCLSPEELAAIGGTG